MLVKGSKVVRQDGSIVVMSGTVKGYPVTFAADARMASAIPAGASVQVESWQLLGMAPFVARALAGELSGKVLA